MWTEDLLHICITCRLWKHLLGMDFVLSSYGGTFALHCTAHNMTPIHRCNLVFHFRLHV